MNVIPMTSPVSPPAAPVGAAVAAEGTDAGLAEAFAALVGALTDQFAPAGAPEVEAEEQADIETGTGDEPMGAIPIPIPPLLGPLPPAAPPADAIAAPEVAVATLTSADPRTGELVPGAPAGDPPVLPDPLDAPEGLTSGDIAEPTGEVGGPVTPAAEVEVDEPLGAVDAGPDAAIADPEPAPPGAVRPDPAVAGEGVTAPVLGVEAPGGVRTVAPVSRVAPTAVAPAPAPAPAPSLPDQLVEVIGPLRQAPDGTHRVSVQLRPDELGEVLVDVRVRGTEVNLSIRADLAGTAELLRDALGELRAELEAAGFSSGDLDVGSQAGRGTPDDRTGAVPDHEPSTLARGSADGRPDPAPAATSGLDVRL